MESLKNLNEFNAMQAECRWAKSVDIGAAGLLMVGLPDQGSMPLLTLPHTTNRTQALELTNSVGVMVNNYTYYNRGAGYAAFDAAYVALQIMTGSVEVSEYVNQWLQTNMPAEGYAQALSVHLVWLPRVKHLYL